MDLQNTNKIFLGVNVVLAVLVAVAGFTVIRNASPVPTASEHYEVSDSTQVGQVCDPDNIDPKPGLVCVDPLRITKQGELSYRILGTGVTHPVWNAVVFEEDPSISEPVTKWYLYTDKNYGFSFQLPVGFDQIETSEFEGVYTVDLGSYAKTSYGSIMVYPKSKGFTQQTVADRAVEGARESANHAIRTVNGVMEVTEVLTNGLPGGGSGGDYRKIFQDNNNIYEVQVPYSDLVGQDYIAAVILGTFKMKQ